MPKHASTRSDGSTRELREWIVEELEARGWSQSRLGRELDVFKGTVGKWLLPDDNPYQRRPSYESCRRLAEVFGVSLESVLQKAGIDDFTAEHAVTPLQRDVMSIIPQIPSRFLPIVHEQLKALIGQQVVERVDRELGEEQERVVSGAPGSVEVVVDDAKPVRV